MKIISALKINIVGVWLACLGLLVSVLQTGQYIATHQSLLQRANAAEYIDAIRKVCEEMRLPWFSAQQGSFTIAIGVFSILLLILAIVIRKDGEVSQLWKQVAAATIILGIIAIVAVIYAEPEYRLLVCTLNWGM